MIRHFGLLRPLAALAMLLAASAVARCRRSGADLCARRREEHACFAFVQAGGHNQGRFPKFAVSFSFADDNLAASHLEVTVDVGALDTGDKERDDTLREADLFNVAKIPASAL